MSATFKTEQNGNPSVVNILVDGSGRVGALSYLVPEGLEISVGDAVTVPFGKRTLHGVVLGSGDPTLATREILQVHGKRVTPEEIEVANFIAKKHFSDIVTVAARLSPRSGRGAPAVEDPEVVVNQELLKQKLDLELPDKVFEQPRALLVTPPLVDNSALSAAIAAKASDAGQVLVLCPTVETVEKVEAFFTSGAVRLDAKAPAGGWKGFAEGKIKIGIGTRSAALYSAAELKTIIVVDEEHPGHTESAQPYTHSREVAFLRSHKQNTDLYLISSNPTPIAADGAKVITLGSKWYWPDIKVMDRTIFAPSDRLIPPPLSALINKANKEKMPVVVLCENRKASRRCARCSTLNPCQECSSSLCRHTPSPCEKCGSQEVLILGWDKERVKNLFGRKAKVVSPKDLHKLDSTPCLFIIFDLDPALNNPGFNPDALASHLVIAAASAAGKEGQVVVLTRNPNNPVVADLCVRKDPLRVARRAWENAKKMQIPPFGTLVTISVGRAKAPSTAGAPGFVHGPRKIADGWEIMIRSSAREHDKLESYITRVRRGGKTRVQVS